MGGDSTDEDHEERKHQPSPGVRRVGGAILQKKFGQNKVLPPKSRTGLRASSSLSY